LPAGQVSSQFSFAADSGGKIEAGPFQFSLDGPIAGVGLEFAIDGMPADSSFFLPDSADIAIITPEPTSFVLVGLSTVVAALFRRRRIFQ